MLGRRSHPPVPLLRFSRPGQFSSLLPAAFSHRLLIRLFDVVAVGEVSGWELVLRLPQVYLGRHLHARPVRHARARKVRLEPLAPLPPLDVDGETYPSGPVTFTIAPGALRIAAAPSLRAPAGE